MPPVYSVRHNQKYKATEQYARTSPMNGNNSNIFFFHAFDVTHPFLRLVQATHAVATLLVPHCGTHSLNLLVLQSSHLN